MPQELVYALGDHLHTLHLPREGEGRVASSTALREPCFRALVWSHRLYAFGASSLQILDISEPFSPRPLGHLHVEREIKNGLVIGCMAFLAHEGPSLTLVDITQPERPEIAGEYAHWPELAPLFPARGPIFICRKHLYTLGGEGRRVLAGRLRKMTLDQQKIMQLRAAS